MQRYMIKDNFFKFWYKFVYPFQAQIQARITEPPMRKIYKELEGYCGRIFEDIVAEFFLIMRGKKIKGMEINFDEYGKWWENDEDIDLVLKSKRLTFFVETKFTNEFIGSRIFEDLKEKSLKTSATGKFKFILISKKGFEKELIERKIPNLLLLSLDEISKILDEETKRENEKQVELKEWFEIKR